MKYMPQNHSLKQFPHFPRIFAALGLNAVRKGGILFLILFLLIFNSFFDMKPKDEEKRLQINVLKEPFSFKTHENLALYYLRANETEAKHEFDLSQELYTFFLTTNHVLGVSDNPFQTWKAETSLREKLLEEKKGWENISISYPDYNYSLAKIAEIEMELGERGKNEEILREIRQHSPSNKEIKILRGEL